MSQLLQAATRNGAPIFIHHGVVVPDYFDQGIPYDTNAGGSLAVHSAGIIDHYHQGLPFTLEGRLCVAIGGVVDSVQPGGIPIDTAGRVVTGAGAVDHYSAGIPYHIAGGINAGAV